MPATICYQIAMRNNSVLFFDKFFSNFRLMDLRNSPHTKYCQFRNLLSPEIIKLFRTNLNSIIPPQTVGSQQQLTHHHLTHYQHPANISISVQAKQKYRHYQTKYHLILNVPVSKLNYFDVFSTIFFTIYIMKNKFGTVCWPTYLGVEGWATG